MKRIIVKSTVMVDQSATEAVLWGGYQIPYIRYANGEIIVKFMGRKDDIESYGMEDADHVYASSDGGKSWNRRGISDWRAAAPMLPNGDRIDFVQRKNIQGKWQLPPTKKHGLYGDMALVYTVDEIAPLIEGLDKTFTVLRFRPGCDEPEEEICRVNWKDMPVTCYKNGEDISVVRVDPVPCRFKADKDGVLWLPVHADAAASVDEPVTSRYNSVHLLKSDDYGKSWDYVSSVYYDPSCNVPNAYLVEGFNEATLEILDNGDFIMIMRSGSLDPRHQHGRPIPKAFIVRSTDRGKTWSAPEVFFDYGIYPKSLRTKDGTILLISGRPGVYLRACDDPEGRSWGEITELVHVPEDDVMERYYEYTCSNADICLCDDGRIFAAYSDFKQKDADGNLCKSIMVSEIGLENQEQM